jgi:transglutaminase-like putative cysteine protease
MAADYRDATRGLPRSVRALLCVLVLAWPGLVAAEAAKRDLSAHAGADYWAGITLAGAPAGYAHTRVNPAARTGRFEIVSEMVMRLRMAGFDKVIEFRGRDVVRADLALESFEAEFRIDGSQLSLNGNVQGSVLSIERVNAGKRESIRLVHDGVLYPASAIGFYPVLHGLQPGSRYEFAALSLESQQVGQVVQTVGAPERVEGFETEAFRVQTRFEGQEGAMWLDAAGRPLAETLLNGMLRALYTTEAAARSHAEASGAQPNDLLAAISRVRTDRRIDLPRQVARMTVELDGVEFAPPSGAGQTCGKAGVAWRCKLDREFRGTANPDARAALQSTLAVPVDDARIRDLAQRITRDAANDPDRVRAILGWIARNIRQELADRISALDVLAAGSAECQGHTYLYAALARASGIPTRVVNGLVYSEAEEGFLYHTWAESLLESRWQAVDPTFSQYVADATHLMLMAGESPAELGPLNDLIGRPDVGVRVRAVEYAR